MAISLEMIFGEEKIIPHSQAIAEFATCGGALHERPNFPKVQE
jgi:hypothetical protein